MCEISKICPIFLSLNIKRPIVVKIKNGLELFVYAISRSASIGEINLFFFKLQTTFAPIGYPLIFPKIKAIDASPGTLKIGFIIGVKTLPNIDAIFVFNSNSVAIKNGNKDGKILTIQSSNPDFVAFSAPEAIVLFGGLAKSGDYIMKPIKKALDENVLKIYEGKTKLLISELKDADAAVLGASALGWEVREA